MATFEIGDVDGEKATMTLRGKVVGRDMVRLGRQMSDPVLVHDAIESFMQDHVDNVTIGGEVYTPDQVMDDLEADIMYMCWEAFLQGMGKAQSRRSRRQR